MLDSKEEEEEEEEAEHERGKTAKADKASEHCRKPKHLRLCTTLTQDSRLFFA